MCSDRLRLANLVHQPPPFHQVGSRDSQPQALGDKGADPCILEHQRHFVDAVGRVHGHDGARFHIGEEGDLFARAVAHRLVRPADDHVGLDADAAQLGDAVLGRLGLQLVAAGDVGQQGHVDVERVGASHILAHLADGLQERQALDVTHRATDLDDDHIGIVVPSGLLDTPLDLVGDVGDHLDGAAQVVAMALFGQHLVVDLAGGHVVGLAQILIYEALVVAQVQIGLGAVVGDEHLAVLVGRHGAGVYVQVRVELLGRDLQPPALEQPADGCSRHALAQAAHDATGDEDVGGHNTLLQTNNRDTEMHSPCLWRESKQKRRSCRKLQDDLLDGHVDLASLSDSVARIIA